ncbi:putative capsid protein [Odonata-associated circular virus-20]|uniref:Capsid protein n=1 Tax=Odonata-associated circular virus-20 TaxID=1592121 RepID=A0A0B4UGV4_9VIRU|nr:putative capsid protein [Odonata-associated circular virus-20]
MSKRFNWSNVGSWARAAAPYVRSALNAYAAYRSSYGQGSSSRMRSGGSNGRSSGYRRSYVRKYRRPYRRFGRRVYRGRVKRYGGRMRTFMYSSPRTDNAGRVILRKSGEVSLVWSADNTTSDFGFKALSLDQTWLPTGTEAGTAGHVFNSYRFHMLRKVSWTMRNMRVFIATQLYQPAISQTTPVTRNAPAQQTFDVQQKTCWRFMRYNMAASNDPLLATSQDERATRLVVNCDTKTYGRLSLGKARQMNWSTLALANIPTNLNEFLRRYMRTGVRGDETTTVPPALMAPEFFPTLNIQLQPDDPYPPSSLTSVQLVSVKLSFEADVDMYSEWICKNQI